MKAETETITLAERTVPDQVVKRDGRVVDFDSEKITKAILKAGRATGEFDKQIAEALTRIVLTQIKKLDTTPEVEQIQDLVENVLLHSPYKKTAKAYIIYREQHKRIREITTKYDVDLVDKYLGGKDWRIKENSNMTYSLQGLNHFVSSALSKVYWLNKIYPVEAREAHKSGDFHIHDLSLLSTYCVGWDLMDLLTMGFGGVSGKLESKPAKHLRTALGQIVNFFYTLQGESAGAQAFSNFDTLLAPFIRYDDLDYEGVKQAIQEFVFNLNVPTRVGFQTPFTNVTLDLQPPKFLRDQPVIRGGEPQDETYGDFQEEIDMFNRAFLEVLKEGDAKGRIFSFPIPTYNITKDFNWDNENLDILWEVTAKYGIPYFANFVNSSMNPDDARSMCCRLRLDLDELRARGGGLFGADSLTGSIGVITLNMARLGLLADSEEEFLERVEHLMNVAKDALEVKRKVVERFTEKGLYPYTKHYLAKIKEKTGEYWSNHFSTIGLIGMNEACLNFLGKDVGSEEGREFALRVLDFMRNKLVDFQKQTGNLYNLEATPAEGTSYSIAQKDVNKFPEAFDNDTESFHYTNSSQLPVDYSNDLFEVLNLQDDIQTKYTGGTVLHLFAGEKIDNPAVVKNLIRKITNNYELPYLTITPTFSICPACGYLSGEQENCQDCGKKTEIYSRVVGYFRPVSDWNKGKQAEFEERKTFKVSNSLS